MVASLRDWSSPLFEWNVCRGDHWSPVCVIEIHREPPLSRQCRQLPLRGADKAEKAATPPLRDYILLIE